MKRFLPFLLALTILFTQVACTYHTHPASMPPGQAKKLTGSKSAKPYAPGQVKKRY